MNRLTIAIDAVETKRHDWQAVGPRDIAPAVRAAQRHSKWVRRLRIGIPAVALIGVTGLLLATWFNPLRALSRLPLTTGKLVVSGTRVTTKALKYSGFTSDNRPYEMTAESAIQDLTKPDIVELTGIRARIQMQDNAIADISAASGFFSRSTEILTLTSNIVVVSSTGYEAHLSEAVVDIRKGQLVSKSPVEVTMPNGGLLNANGLQVVEKGELVRFDGGVTMTLNAPNRSNEQGR